MRRDSGKYKDLEDYGVIGNLETCALSGRDGSIDWLCLPYLESPSVFAALLDADKGGHFSIRPAIKYQSVQSYAGDTNVLQTTFATARGTAVLTDFMPIAKTSRAGGAGRALLRKAECREGQVGLEVAFRPRFDYARGVPDVKRTRGGVLATWKGHYLYLNSTVPLTPGGGEAMGGITLKKGESAWLVLRYGAREPCTAGRCEGLLKKTRKFWLDWSHRCEIAECISAEPWHGLAVRSGLVLKLLSNPDTGAIAAAATTSLPESPGGVRNWDYRYAWIRDSSFTDQALYHLGHTTESKDFRRWNLRIMEQAREPSELRVLYGLRDEADLRERVLDHLAGYRGSAPVRLGNDAHGQRQLDIFGEMLNALYDTTRHGEQVSKKSWPMIREVVDHVCRVWDQEDSGIWEVRGGRRHFTYSKLMCWAAVDRGLRMAREKKFEAPLSRWEKARKAMAGAILEKGYNKKLRSFVQAFGSETLDATALLVPMTGFLPFDDHRVRGTINAVRKRLLTPEGLVRRYDGEDGLPGREGAFVLCSFWLVKALALSGRVEEAEEIFARVLGFASPLGLFSEEVDMDTGRLLGNFPQAMSHIGLINSALYLGTARGGRHRKPDLAGTF